MCLAQSNKPAVEWTGLPSYCTMQRSKAHNKDQSAAGRVVNKITHDVEAKSRGWFLVNLISVVSHREDDPACISSIKYTV